MPSRGSQTGRKTQASRPASRQPARQPARQASRQPSRQPSRQASPQLARQQQPQSSAGAHVRSLKPKTESPPVGKSAGKSRFVQKQSGGHGGQTNRPVPPQKSRATAKDGRGRGASKEGRPAPNENRGSPKEGRPAPKEGKGAAFSWRWVRRSTLIFVVSMLTVLFGIAVLQGIVTQTQVQIDTLDDRIEEEAERERVLQQQKTEMSSPARVVEVAKERLGMITAKEIVFLHRPGSQ